jgi:hypothetical protein
MEENDPRRWPIRPLDSRCDPHNNEERSTKQIRTVGDARSVRWAADADMRVIDAP